MKTIEEVINNYDNYKTNLEDRFGRRFCDYIKFDDLKRIGFIADEKYRRKWRPKKWCETNIIKQMLDDNDFGMQKAEDEKGISSSLMFDVVISWLKILEDTELLEEANNYHDYGMNLFIKVKEKYEKRKK